MRGGGGGGGENWREKGKGMGMGMGEAAGRGNPASRARTGAWGFRGGRSWSLGRGWVGRGSRGGRRRRGRGGASLESVARGGVSEVISFDGV